MGGLREAASNTVAVLAKSQNTLDEHRPLRRLESKKTLYHNQEILLNSQEQKKKPLAATSPAGFPIRSTNWIPIPSRAGRAGCQKCLKLQNYDMFPLSRFVSFFASSLPFTLLPASTQSSLRSSLRPSANSSQLSSDPNLCSTLPPSSSLCSSLRSSSLSSLHPSPRPCPRSFLKFCPRL